MKGAAAAGTQPVVGVLASGRGSNFVALADAAERGDLQAQIAVVLSDVADAPVLAAAQARGIAAEFVDPALARGVDGRYSRAAYSDLLLTALQRHGVEYVALAGFMRLIGGRLLTAYKHRIVNIHPSLLPAFPGLAAQRQALDYGVKVTGCTVHLVDAGMDTGPVLAQRAVPVEPGDTLETLTARILAAEHDLYWRTLQQLINGKLRLDGRRATILEG